MPWGFAAAGIASAVVGSALAPDAPDMSGQNAAAKSNAATADRAQQLAETQYSDQKALLDQYSPLYKQQIQASLDAQAKSTEQSALQWDSYTTTWKPVEEALAKKSLDMASPGRADAEAARAGSDTQTQFDRARTDTTQQLSMAGASPEKIAALTAAGRLDEAKAVGGAQSLARRDTESRAMGYLDNAARFGRNMPSTGLATATLAGQQGGQVTGGIQSLAAATAAPAQAAAPLLSTSISANNSAGGLFSGISQMQATADMNQYNATIGGAQAGVKAYGMYRSSKKSKVIDGPVDGRGASDAVEKSGAKHWRYKPGEGDGSGQPRMGPTAESLADAAPAVSDGETVDGISMLGLHHASLGDHNKRLKKLERQMKSSGKNRKD
jgi:hypothetical protein